ncbi:FadR family transcriptional regulator [Altericroceibacterium spongiae]|uniref:FadR family transcriptional regulator n=1 Tax=Altericroceibacterium spongiae TaxID=2320269 RepID=A0A420EAD6_9SPHN|nr:FadR/GntR family transcriptional regulator [Altericroceibacterium spongiae]RKF17648.1 FadR family transcriptional regulator [Altericroceibacterium spongiae]
MRNSSSSEKTGSKGLRLHGTIARKLGIQIVSGAYQPGEVLVGEIEASERLNVSRTAYREAVRILAAKGMVESKPKRGTQVTDRARWHLLDPDVLSWIFEFEPPESLLSSLFELRRIVEPQAAALAAYRRKQSHIDIMEQALADMSEYTLATPEGRAADQKFHEALLDAADNPFLVTLTSGVGAAVAWTTIFKQRHSPLRRDPVPDHQRVFNAVKAQDREAAHQAMTDLVEKAYLDTAHSGGGSPRPQGKENDPLIRKPIA